MGAEYFEEQASGSSAQEAFTTARDDAQYHHGHAGYTGTIAEKSEFVIIDLPQEYKNAWTQYIDKALDQVEDKWGPAGCFDLGDNKYVFFGYASS